MSTTGTTDEVTTDTTDTTDGVSESPVTRTPLHYRVWDVMTGAGLMMFGGILVWKGIKPHEYHEWQAR